MWNAFVHVPHLQTPCQQIMTGVTSAKQRHCVTLYGIKLKKNSKKFGSFAEKQYLCTRKDKVLGYGVMVTLQILVLPFLVRVRVSQP